MNNPTIQELRVSGNKVRCVHSRFTADQTLLIPNNVFKSNPVLKRSSRGGSTVIEIVTPENKIGKGVALCSKKDAFCRKKGLELALTRAMAQIEG
jgi:hypothetical protein